MNRDRNDTNCFIWLSYLLEVCMIKEELFSYVASMPSPCYLYANYVDWIFPFVGEFLRKKEKMSYYLNYGMAQMFSHKMKENLIAFEKKYLQFVRLSRPDCFTQDGRLISGVLQVVNTNDIYYGPSSQFDEFGSNFKSKVPLVAIYPTPLIGTTSDERVIKRLELYENKYENLTLDISEVSMNLAESKPTGETNIAIPQEILVGKQIFKRKMPKECQFANF